MGLPLRKKETFLLGLAEKNSQLERLQIKVILCLGVQR